MSWSDLVKAGHSWIHAIQIEGIPHIFVEAMAYRVDASSTPGVPSGYTSAVECLNITDGDKVSINIDRQTGGASGDAFDVVLNWEGLEDNALDAALFSEPGVTMMLDADLGITTGAKVVVDTTGWTAANAYIGIERVALSVIDGLRINLTARGLSGSFAGVYKVKSPTYKMVTDKPVIWRGRQVSIWRHLVSPENRVIADTWCDPSAAEKWCRVIWRGYVDAPPRPSPSGMALRCLPLVRRASLPLGHQITAQTYGIGDQGGDGAGLAADYDPDAVAGFPTYTAPGSQLFTWQWTSSATISGKCSMIEGSDGVFTLGQLADLCYAGTLVGGTVSDPMETTIAATATDVLQIGARAAWDGNADLLMAPYLEFRFQTTGTACDVSESWIQVAEGCPYFLFPGLYHFKINTFSGNGGYDINDEFATVQIPIRMPTINLYSLAGYWIPLVGMEGSAWNDVSLPASGFALLGDSNFSGGLIEWDAVQEGPFDDLTTPNAALVRVKAVHEQSGPGLWFQGVDFKYVTGKIGTVKEILLTLLESSGAANRGTYDTLALGQGAGIDEDLINEVSFGHAGLTDYQVACYSVGASSVVDLLGGHLALRGLCLVQRMTDPDATESGAVTFGDCILTIVSADVAIADSSSVTISLAEALLESVDAPEPAEAPNIVTVAIETALMGGQHTITIQDLPRIQAEGPSDVQYGAPGMYESEAGQLAASLVRRGDGESILTLQLAPWVEIQPGDMVDLTIAHPVTYDFVTGQRAPASIGARCLGWETDLFNGQQRVTLLLAGNAFAVGPLCPSVSIASKDSSTEATLSDLFDKQWLDESTTVLLYNVGEEQAGTAESAQNTITDISDAVPCVVTFGSSLPSWVGADTIITFPLVANCSVRQAKFTHNSTASRLS